MGNSSHQSGRYALGHSDEEVERLETQARIVDPVTRRFWSVAGVEPGMRVLDVGCGAGHTTVLLADMVGGQGQVVGIDNAASAVAVARARSRERRESAMSTVTQLLIRSTPRSTRSWDGMC